MNKYRAWDKEQKEMYGVYGWNEIDKEVYMCSVHESKFRDGSMHTWHQVTKQLDKVIVMQSTGLKDKNGVEIFEGDVVETIYEEEIFVGVVVYDQSEVGYKVTNGCEEYGSNFYYLTGNDSNEVQGNIHENPELLK